MLGCRDLAEQMNKGYIRSRNNNHSSYDENLNEKREQKKVHSAILNRLIAGYI